MSQGALNAPAYLRGTCFHQNLLDNFFIIDCQTVRLSSYLKGPCTGI